MQRWLNSLIARGTFGSHPPAMLIYAVGITIACAIVLFAIAVPFASVVTWVERRVWARIQSRIGPNRVGPNGFLQWLADGIKHVCKEDVIPAEADRRLFKLAPYLVVLAFILPWAVMPFSSSLILADLNVGILYMTAVTALTVVGLLMAGWASNNKWSLIGGIRSAAQIISYEIPAGLSIFPVVLITGTLSMQGIIKAQGWAPDRWFMFDNPFCFAAAIILFISGLAENNRTPFDLPEAESELVAGFATEYFEHALPVLLHGGMGQHVRLVRDRGDIVHGRMAIPARQQQRPHDERPATYYLQCEGAIPGAGLDVDSRDAAARAHRSNDVTLLEIPCPDRLHRHDRHGGMGRAMARRQSGRFMDHAGARRDSRCFVYPPRDLLCAAIADGTLFPSNDLGANLGSQGYAWYGNRCHILPQYQGGSHLHLRRDGG